MCVGDVEQTSDFEKKKGTIYSFSQIKCLSIIREELPKILGNKAKSMLAEGNLYSDVNKNGIGYMEMQREEELLDLDLELKKKVLLFIINGL